MIALALIPANKVEKGLQCIEEEIEMKIKNQKKQEKWKSFISYFKSQWMKKVGVDCFCVYGLVDRTNNFVGRFYKIMFVLMLMFVLIL